MTGPQAAATLLALPLLIAGPLACSDPPSPGSSELPEDALLHDLRGGEEEAPLVLVRLLPGPGERTVQPDSIVLQAGAVIRFVLAGGVPDAIVFDTTGLGPEARAFMRERGLVRGPLLLGAGQTYDVDLRGAPVGRYPFRSVRGASREGGGVVEIGRTRERSDLPVRINLSSA